MKGENALLYGKKVSGDWVMGEWCSLFPAFGTETPETRHLQERRCV